MSQTKLFIENTMGKVAAETGYSFDFLMDSVMEYVNDEGMAIDEAIKLVSDIAYEQDFMK